MIIFFLLSMTVITNIVSEQRIELSAKNDTSKTSLFINYVTSKETFDNHISLKIIEDDLLFLEQFNLKVVHGSKIVTKQERAGLLKQNYFFVILILDDSQKVDLYIIDLTTNKTLLGKRILKKKRNCRTLAHNISDLIVESLTGSPSFFSTHIAYTKEYLTQKNAHISTKQLCIAEYHGENEQVIVKNPSLIFGLRWDHKIPRIFYSQHTKTNVQLRVADLTKKKRFLVSDEDGITMLPTFMPDKQGIIVSATGNNGFAQLYKYDLQGITQLTFYTGNSTAPSIFDNILYFCSDFKNNSPDIFAWNMQNSIETAEQITHEGYCTSPIINSIGTVLAYTKLVKGYMQIFLYDVYTKTHRQITFDDNNKDSCSWSPCNTYLLYGSTKDNTKQIIQLNIINGKKKQITSAKYRCSSPAWSPIYQDFPWVLS